MGVELNSLGVEVVVQDVLVSQVSFVAGAVLSGDRKGSSTKGAMVPPKENEKCSACMKGFPSSPHSSTISTLEPANKGI